jgi:hypothetical protein
MSSDRVVLRDIDKFEFSRRVSSSLEGDNVSESCYTNFRENLILSIASEVRWLTNNDGWKLKYWEKNKEDKIFNGFMENGEVKVLLEKKNDKGKYETKKVIVKFDFSDEDKKKIAELYIDNLLDGLYYLDLCVFKEVYHDFNEISVDTISRYLSGEVYGLLTSDEIKNEFKDRIQRAIDKINEQY